MNPSLVPFEKLLVRAGERHNCKDSEVTEFVERTKCIAARELFDHHAEYHGLCFKSITNTEKVQRAKKCYSDSIETGEPSICRRKAGRPSLVAKNREHNESLTTRSKTQPFDKSACVICQKPGGELHEVTFDSTWENMLSVSKKLEDKSFFCRLNSISHAEDAVANDVLYHHICWNSAKRQAEPNSYPIDNAIKTTSDIELLSLIESFFNHDAKSKVLDMNNVNSIYRKVLLENGELQKASLDKKKHLQTLIIKNVSDTVFIKSKNRNKPEQIITSLTQSEVISDICDSTTTNNDIKSLLKTAKKIREEIL